MSDSSLERVPPRVFAAARNLVVDRITAEVVAELTGAGVRPILLKGPSIARWLYDDAPRMYADTDLLVAPDATDLTEAILSGMSFEPPLPESWADRPWQVHDWRRNSDGAMVDLHRTIPGAEADPAVVWATLSRATDRLEVAGVVVEVLSLPGRALNVALHAAHPGAEMTQPLEDLRRSLARSPLAVWEAASALAEEIRATNALADGLNLLPSGQELLGRLGLEGRPRIETALAHADLPRPTAGYALALEELGHVSGIRAKAVWLGARLVPPVVFMRYWTPLARRGPAGLVAAYVWRWIWLAKTALPGLAAWLWARRLIARGRIGRN